MQSRGGEQEKLKKKKKINLVGVVVVGTGARWSLQKTFTWPALPFLMGCWGPCAFVFHILEI